MSASMAEVVAQHLMADADSCACDEMFYDYRLPAEQIKVEHSLHVEERLAANGYGKLEDAWDACNAADTPWINPHRRPE